MTCLWTLPCWWRARYTPPFITHLFVHHFLHLIILSVCSDFPLIVMHFLVFLCLSLSLSVVCSILVSLPLCSNSFCWLLSHLQLAGLTSHQPFLSHVSALYLSSLFAWPFYFPHWWFSFHSFTLFGHKRHTPIKTSPWLEEIKVSCSFPKT